MTKTRRPLGRGMFDRRDHRTMIIHIHVFPQGSQAALMRKHLAKGRRRQRKPNPNFTH